MKLVVAIILYALIISQLSLQFGISQETWTAPTELETPTEDCNGFLCGLDAAIQAVLVPLRWTFNAIAVIVTFMTYQVDGIPPLINTVIITPLGAGILWLAARIIRGGG
jgi:hypothetical protein